MRGMAGTCVLRPGDVGACTHCPASSLAPADSDRCNDTCVPSAVNMGNLEMPSSFGCRMDLVRAGESRRVEPWMCQTTLSFLTCEPMQSPRASLHIRNLELLRAVFSALWIAATLFRGQSDAVLWLVAVVSPVGFSWIAYHAIEQPGLALGGRLTRRPAVTKGQPEPIAA